MGAAAGSSITETVWLFPGANAGPNPSFTASVRYLGSQQGWLSVSPSSGTAPAQLTLTANAGQLPPGTYSAQVLANVGLTQATAFANVVLTVGSIGSAAGGVAASPSTLTFNSQSLTPQTITVVNAPGTTGTAAFSVFANPSNWLTFTASGSTTPGSIAVLPMANNLAPGTYPGSVTITAASGAATVVPVTLYVPPSSTGPSIALTPAQQALLFNYQINSGVNPYQTVFVSTGAGSTQSANYTATASAPWIGLADNSIDIATPSASVTDFAPGLLFVAVNPAGLGAGQYQGNITLSAPGLASAPIPVTLNVSATPVFNAQPSFIALDSGTNLLSSSLMVTASTATFFNATVTAPWLSVSPTSGDASANPVSLTVTASTSGLQPGSYSATVILTGSGGTPQQIVPVRLTVAGQAPASAPLQTSPATLSFAGISGTGQQPQFVLIAKGSNQVPFFVSAASDTGWLSVSPVSGVTPALVQVNANSALAGGTYNGSVTFTAPQSNETATVAVTYTVTARKLTASPASLTFTQQTAGAPIASQTVTVTANATSTFQIAAQPAWLKITSAALTTPATLAVSVNAAGLALAPGTYQDTIQLSGPNTLAIPVILTIAAPPPPGVSPSSLTFNYLLGSPAPQGQTLQITNPAVSLSFTTTATTDSSIPWLTVTPATGFTPSAVTVGVATAQLVPGKQTGSIAITLQNGASFKVPVTLNVTGSVIQLQGIFNAATLAPASIAPGEIVTLTGFGLGPETGTVVKPTTAGAYPTTAAGTTVTFDGIPAPLLFVQGEQINAIAPYELYGRTSSQVQVQSGTNYSVPISALVTNAAPGIFTGGSSGTGGAAALNADGTTNSALNPAPRGTPIVLYLTGEGQTAPAGQDGRVILTDLRTPLLPVTATIGGEPATVLYAGSAPTLVSGLCQVNLLIPQDLPPGTQSVEVQIGGIPSQHGVTIEVR